jgi:DNA-binding transcriptional LysR family regulator
MARWLLDQPAGRLTYKGLASRIRSESKGTLACAVLWTADVAVHNLKRCLRKLADHFGQDLIIEAEDGELALQDFGKRVYEVFQSVSLQMLELYPRDRSAAPLTVRVADSLACEIIPGALRRLRGRLPDRPPFCFGRIDYQRIEAEIRDRRTAFGLGWRVRADAWFATKPVPLGPPIDLVFVASPAEMLRGNPSAQHFRDAVTREHPLFVLHGDLKLPGFEEALRGIGPERIVEVLNFQAVLTHAHRGDGVGVLPLLPWVIERLRVKGRIVYARVPDVEPQQIICYLPRDGEERLDEPARHLLEAIRDNFGHLSQSADFREDPVEEPRPRPARGTRRRAGPG